MRSILQNIGSKRIQRRIAARHPTEIVFHRWPWSDTQLGAFTSSATAAEGSYQALLEKELRAYLDIADDVQVTLLGSGRTALRLGLTELRKLRPERRRVIIPTYCCGSVHEAVVLSGLVPVYVDTTDNLVSLTDQYLSALDDSILAVVVVNLCGQWIEEQSRQGLLDACRRRGAFVIEDNAQCYRRCFGEPADMEIHSFGFGKMGMATAGGALTSWVASPEIGEALQNYRTGTKASATQRFRYFQQKFGAQPDEKEPTDAMSNTTDQYGDVFLSELDAALALEGLRNAPATIERSISIGERFVAAIKSFPEVYRPTVRERNIFFRFPVILRSVQLRDLFWTHMRSCKIELEGMYIPLHLRHPEDHVSMPLGKAESLYQCIFNIPNRVTLSSVEVDRIVDAVASFGKRQGR
jgi:dTDP-4-amino-4,6-dideoxygalactose transaminase